MRKPAAMKTIGKKGKANFSWNSDRIGRDNHDKPRQSPFWGKFSSAAPDNAAMRGDGYDKR